jgi:hypothetical protein
MKKMSTARMRDLIMVDHLNKITKGENAGCFKAKHHCTASCTIVSNLIYYMHRRTAQHFADDVLARLRHVGVAAEQVSCKDVWREYPRESYWEAVFKLVSPAALGPCSESVENITEGDVR